MPYWIYGRDDQTGETTRPYYSDSNDETIARALAEEQGLIVDSIERVGSQDGRSSGSIICPLIASFLFVLVVARGPVHGISQAFSVSLAISSCILSLIGLRVGMKGFFEERRRWALIGIAWNELVIALWIGAGVAFYVS